MRLLLIFLIFILSDVRGTLAATFGGDKYVSSDFVIENSDYYMPDSLHVSGVVGIENNGRLETDIFVHDGAMLYIENHADVDSVFYLGNGAHVIQKISDVKDMKAIDFNVPYSVMVDGANMLPWTDVINFASGADKIILGDSVFDINGFVVNDVENIELRGDVFLVLNSAGDVYDNPFITGVSGTGRVYVIANNPNPLYTDVAVLRDGNLYFERQRETDYLKIFDNDVGHFLNLLRMNNSNDKLLNALDSATNVNSFNRMLGRSARFSEDILTRPLRILNVLNLFDYRDGVSGDVWGVKSDDFYSYGISLSIYENIATDLNVGIGVGVGKLEYDGKYDVYAGDLFGVDLLAAWNMDNHIVIRGMGGVLYQNTDIGDVLYENKVYKNPDVSLWYLKSDIGYRDDLFDAFYLNSYVGMDFDNYSVADIVENDFDLYSGATLGYKFIMMGIRYDYSIGVDINTDLDIGMRAGIGFMSDMDMMGGNAEFSAIRMLDVMTYKLSVGVRFVF